MFVLKSFLAPYFSQLGQLLLAIILLEYFLQDLSRTLLRRVR